MVSFYLVSKAGKLRSGSDAHGSIWHYSERDPESGLGCDHPALCGASPHIMWSRTWQPDQTVTCKKCERLANERLLAAAPELYVEGERSAHIMEVVAGDLGSRGLVDLADELRLQAKAQRAALAKTTRDET